MLCNSNHNKKLRTILNTRNYQRYYYFNNIIFLHILSEVCVRMHMHTCVFNSSFFILTFYDQVNIVINFPFPSQVRNKAFGSRVETVNLSFFLTLEYTVLGCWKTKNHEIKNKKLAEYNRKRKRSWTEKEKIHFVSLIFFLFGCYVLSGNKSCLCLL